MITRREPPETVDPQVSTSGLSPVAQHATHSAAWTAVAFGATKGSTLLLNLVLARLLSPSEFGTVSFAMIFIGLLLLLQDLGVPAAIVYGNRSAQELAGTALTINVAMAVALTVFVVLASPFLAQWGNNPTIEPVAIALAAGLIVSSIGSVQVAVLIRNLAFKRKAAPDIIPAVAGGLVSIVFALTGFGVWSLVAGYTVKVVSSTAILWLVSDVRPRPEFRRPIATELFHYGRHVSFASLVGSIASNADYLIVGAVLGSHALGIYTIAFNLAILPCTVVQAVIVTVLFPALSSVRENPTQYRSLLSMAFHVTVALSVVMSLGIFICSPPYITTFLTSKWSDVIAPLQLLTAYAVLRSIGSWTSPIYKASGRPDLEWRLSLPRLVIHPPLMLVLSRYGIEGVAVSHFFVNAVFLACGLVALGRVTEIGMTGLWALIRPHFLSGALTLSLLMLALLTPVGAQVMASMIGAPLVFAILACTYLYVLGRAEPTAFLPLHGITAHLASRFRNDGRSPSVAST